MKKLTIVMAVLLVACSFILTVDTVSAALANTENTWSAEEDETLYIWDSGIGDLEISAGEEFGLYTIGTDPTASGTNTMSLLDGIINSGMVTFSLENDYWTAYYSSTGQSFSLNAFEEGNKPEWGFYLKTDDGIFYTVFTTGFPSPTDYLVYDISGLPNAFELAQDGIRASVSTSPIPIPTAGLLLLSGLMGLAGVRTRFKKN